MKNATEFAKKFKTFCRKLPSAEIVPSENGVIGELIYSHLLWNATAKQATTAYKKLIDSVVDMNDLRVNHVFELVELIGVSYPQAEARAKRLRTVLNAIYLREHDVSVGSLDGLGKREIREYFETLSGITTFVCYRVILLCYEVSAMPVDEKTLAALISCGIVHEDTDINEAAAWLSRQVKANDAAQTHVRLQAWVETQKIGSPVKTTKKKTGKKVAKKKVTIKKIAKKVVKKSPKKTASKKTAKTKSSHKKTKKK